MSRAPIVLCLGISLLACAADAPARITAENSRFVDYPGRRSEPTGSCTGLPAQKPSSPATAGAVLPSKPPCISSAIQGLSNPQMCAD